MRKLEGDPLANANGKSADRLRWLAQAANDITDTLLRSEPGESAASIAALGERYSKVLGLSAKAIESAAVEARVKLSQMAQAMNLHVAPSSPASRLLRSPPQAEPPAVEEHDSLAAHQLHATLPVSLRPVPVEPGAAADGLAAQPAEPAHAVNPADVMAAGIQDITNSMVESFRLNEVLRMILETMYRALGFRCVVFCLRDPRTDMMIGRFGLGQGVEQVQAAFKVAMRAPNDLFSAVCLKGADTLITDATVPTIASRLPAWYKQTVNAPAFLVLPLVLRGAPFAMIYADKATPGAIELGEKELSLLRTLRNQAVMAFKQAG
jgi:hypothetical protein